jgi:TctA family transporter
MIGSGNDITIFFTRPVNGALMFVSIGFLFMPVVRSYREHRKRDRVQITG